MSRNDISHQGLETNLKTPPELISTQSQTDPFAEWRSYDFWQEQFISLIPLVTGMVLTSGLRVNGLAAVPIFLITSDATRRVIEYLNLQITPQSPSPKLESESTSSNSVDTVAAPSTKIAYSVVHQIPGRIRFHLPLVTQDLAYTERLERLLTTDHQVTSVRINRDAASIAIAYKADKISISYWENLMELAVQRNQPTEIMTTPALQITADAANQDSDTIPQDASKVSENNTLVVSSLWADMQPLFLSYSLELMANSCNIDQQ